MKYNIFLAIDAEQDIFDIYQYIFYNDSPKNAEYVFNKIKETIDRLSEFPDRGHLPREFDKINIKDFLEIHFKPYRIIYQISEENVVVHCVLDGRRELEELLHKRLLR